MTNYRDKLKESQGEGSDIPRLDVDLHLEMKQSPNGKSSFRWWDGEKKQAMHSTKPITGILIGAAMVAEGFSRDLGNKGGTYKTSFYFTKKDSVALFGDGRVAAKGTMEEIENWVSMNTSEKKLSKKRVLFIKTKQGFVAIATNLSLAIDNIKKFDRETFLDYAITLTPQLYAPDDTAISQNCHEKYLGPLAATNPPTFAVISKGEAITDEMAAELNIEPFIDMYKAFKKYQTGGNDAPATTQQTPPPEQAQNPMEGRDIPNGNEQGPLDGPDDDINDLPF